MKFIEIEVYLNHAKTGIFFCFGFTVSEILVGHLMICSVVTIPLKFDLHPCVYAPIPLKQNQSPTFACNGIEIFLAIMSIPSQVIPKRVEFVVSKAEEASLCYNLE